MTINGLKNTIRYDEDVFRWALALLQVDSISKVLPKNKIYILRILHCLMMAINLGAVLFVFQVLLASPRLFDLVLILIIALGVYLFELPYKNLTADLVIEFVEAKFPVQELENRTLLQLSLQLEEKFGAVALVETLWGWTKFFRVVLLLAFIAIAQFTLFLCGVWVFRAISRSTTLTSFLKTFS